MEEALFYSEKESVLFIKAEGHITANLCFELRERVFNRFKTAIDLADVYIDLSRCDYMDSTFMGLLIGFNKKMTALTGKHIKILNPTDTCIKLLKGLGIIKLLDIERQESPLPNDMEKISDSPSATAEILLNAHENLMELSNDNKRKFETLQKVLKEQIKLEKKEE